MSVCVIQDERAGTEGGAGRPEILYIAGFGRSGTTVLHVLLANAPGVVGVGEVAHIFRDGAERNDECSCGLSARLCPVWSPALRRVSELGSTPRELTGLFKRFEAHRRFPVVAVGRLPKDEVERYRGVNAALYSALAEASSADCVVDSSKFSGRAIMLDEVFPGRVRVIFVTRSPAGLMSSFRKPRRGEQRQKSVPGVMAYHAYVLTCLRLAMRRFGDKAIHVRYDDLVSDPDGTLSKIEQWWGRDLSIVRGKVRRGEWLEVGHIVTGNRIRKKGRIVFDPSAAHAPVGRVARAGTRLMHAYEALLTRMGV